MNRAYRWLFALTLMVMVVVPIHAQDDGDPNEEVMLVDEVAEPTPTVIPETPTPIIIIATATVPMVTPLPTAVPPPIVGTRQSPIPLGTPADTGTGWVIRVSQPNSDATREILAANRFNSPPKPGYQFFLVHIEATNNGTRTLYETDIESGTSTVGASQVSYVSFDQGCGVTPNRLSGVRQVFPGGTTSGDICWQVRTEDVASLVMYFDSFNPGGPMFFALH